MNRSLRFVWWLGLVGCGPTMLPPKTTTSTTDPTLGTTGVGDDDDDDTTRTTDTDPTTTTDSDRDGDGVTDLDEEALGSDPDLADTDGDGWDDGEEVDGNTDPTAAADHPYTGGWAIGACRHDLVPTGTDVGDVVPDFVLVDQFGDSLHLHDFCDREVLLVSAAFW